MKTKIKVLHLFPSNKYSGAENVVLAITDMFKASSELSMKIVCRKGPIKKQLDEHGVEYDLLDEFNYKSIKEIVYDYRPNVIHAHDFSATIMATRFKIPVIAHLHNNPIWQKSINLKSIVYALCIHKLSKVYGVSSSIYDEYIFKRFYSDKFEVLSNVVDKEKVIRMADQNNEGIDIIDIIFVGRLETVKNPMRALEIINKVNEAHKNTIRAVFLGDGQLRSECEIYIKKNHLEENVKLLGQVDNPYKYMKKAKMLLMPSVYEGFGLVAVEAMILGVPVVCSNVGGLPQIVDEHNGNICCTMDDYFIAINELLSNESVRLYKSDNAKRKSLIYTEINNYRETLIDEYKKYDIS